MFTPPYFSHFYQTRPLLTLLIPFMMKINKQYKRAHYLCLFIIYGGIKMKRTLMTPLALGSLVYMAIISTTAFAGTVENTNHRTTALENDYGAMAPAQVSKQTWQTISAWSTDSLSLLDFMAENDEEAVLNHYIEKLTATYRAEEILSQIKEIDVNALDLWSTVLADHSPEDSYYLARYLIQYKPALFKQWLTMQKMVSLAEFVEINNPRLFEAWFETYAAPKKKGLSVLSYNKEMDPTTYNEIKELLNKDAKGGPKSACACQMVVPNTGSGTVVTNYPSTPSSPAPETSSDNKGMSKHGLNFTSTAYGAFHSGDGERWSKHKAYGYDNTISHNSTEFSVKMLCADKAGFDCNQSNSCSGNLEVRGTYASRFHVKGTARQIWSKATNAHSADGAKFAVDLPGSAPEIVLFNKAGGAAMSFNTGWDINSVLGTIKAALGITAAIVNDNAGSLLDAQLASDLITNIAGIITRSGNEASVNSTMRARFDSSDVSPFLLQPNEVYHFTLDSEAHVKARGYGGYSDSHFEFGSSGAVMYAANHFTCGPNVTAPMPTGLWFYASQSGPDNTASLRSDVEGWLSIQLNQGVNAIQQQGVVY